MSIGKQARIKIRVRMIQQGLTFTALAEIVGHPRPTVSKAVNHGRFPRVLKKVQEALCV